MSKENEQFAKWVASLSNDVATLQAVVEAENLDKETRKLAGAGLNYLLMRMNLIPDWEGSIGILDDVLVIRTLAAEIAQCDLGSELDTQVQVDLARLGNEAENAAEWMGDELWRKFTAYACNQTPHKPVRGRTPERLTEKSSARKEAWAELADYLLKLKLSPPSFEENTADKFKSYLKYKL